MNQATEKLRQVFPQVLQKQIFMFAEEISLDDLPPGATDWVETRISFSGPITGDMRLALPRVIEMEIAANFLGKDVEDSEVAKFCEDALKETINVLCGHMLTSIAGEEPIFDLSIPIVTALSSDQYAKLSELPESVCFDVEGKCVVVSFSISDSIPQLLNGN